MAIAVVRTNDGQDDMNLDIDRWENDGGRNIHPNSNCITDNFY